MPEFLALECKFNLMPKNYFLDQISDDEAYETKRIAKRLRKWAKIKDYYRQLKKKTAKNNPKIN